MLSQSLQELLFKTAKKSDVSIKCACVIIHRGKVKATGFNYIDWCRFQHGRGNPQCLL